MAEPGKDPLTAREEELEKELADLTVQRVKNDPKLMRTIVEGLAALERGEEGVPAQEYFRQWRKEHGKPT